MIDALPDCIATQAEAGGALTLHGVRPERLAAFLAGLDRPQADFLRAGGFAAAAQELVLLPGGSGVAGAVLGLGADRSRAAYGDLAYRLPAGTAWRLATGEEDTREESAGDAALGFLLGAYRYAAFKPPKRAAARLVLGPEHARARRMAEAICMARDLINTPANLLGPAELADAAMELASRFGAEASRCTGERLDAEYPTIAAVGRGSVRKPHVVLFRWRGTRASGNAPIVSLCGKGVCFDTGGYDLKPSAGMLRMKKDMGGAAAVLGMARAIMAADLPVRLAVRIGCVENSVSGDAMRPLDVLRTRRGLSVEVGNTDAEGRLVLCDLLAEASDEAPDLLLDCATLTGAARVALGPDLPALFCTDDALATRLMQAGEARHDPMWRLPLWDKYDPWLGSPVADLNNVASKPFAGAIVAALFLRRFIAPEVKWAHLDMYAWNDSTTPGSPEGGEGQAIDAIVTAVERQIAEQEQTM